GHASCRLIAPVLLTALALLVLANGSSVPTSIVWWYVLLPVIAGGLAGASWIGFRLHPDQAHERINPIVKVTGTGQNVIDTGSPAQADRLLGRVSQPNAANLGCVEYCGRTVMISGAGGSIGSELCRQILACSPARLVLFDMSEFALFTIERELSALTTEQKIDVIPILGSVADPVLVAQVLDRYNVDVVLHAAAYKHLTLVEQNPLSGIENNVLATATLAQLSAERGVRRFVLVSSDKAVRPTSVMGATKRLAEHIVGDLARRTTDTVFSIVRFGNVLGSSGSVVPIFQDQIAKGGPVTLTDGRATRYFMTVHEAAQLVLRAGCFAEGGEVFVLDMGAAVNVLGLARQMIREAGFSVRDAENPQGDIEIVTTGLRQGEKLQEDLLEPDAEVSSVHHKIFRVREQTPSEIEVAATLRDLRHAMASRNSAAAIHALNLLHRSAPAVAYQR
ncbi:MAG: UDP-N-acetylglucosamine 4,6-dehydratase family protein, partial [Halocynthiibacter sp.]